MVVYDTQTLKYFPYILLDASANVMCIHHCGPEGSSQSQFHADQFSFEDDYVAEGEDGSW